MQTAVAIVAGLDTRWLHRWALLIGWASQSPTARSQLIDSPGPQQRILGSSLAYFPFTQTKVYIAVAAMIINVIVAVGLSAILRVLGERRLGSM